MAEVTHYPTPSRRETQATAGGFGVPRAVIAVDKLPSRGWRSNLQPVRRPVGLEQMPLFRRRPDEVLELVSQSLGVGDRVAGQLKR